VDEMKLGSKSRRRSSSPHAKLVELARGGRRKAPVMDKARPSAITSNRGATMEVSALLVAWMTGRRCETHRATGPLHVGLLTTDLPLQTTRSSRSVRDRACRTRTDSPRRGPRARDTMIATDTEGEWPEFKERTPGCVSRCG